MMATHPNTIVLNTGRPKDGFVQFDIVDYGRQTALRVDKSLRTFETGRTVADGLTNKSGFLWYIFNDDP